MGTLWVIQELQKKDDVERWFSLWTYDTEADAYNSPLYNALPRQRVRVLKLEPGERWSVEDQQVYYSDRFLDHPHSLGEALGNLGNVLRTFPRVV